MMSEITDVNVVPIFAMLLHDCRNLKMAVAESKAGWRPVSYNGACAQLLWLRPPPPLH
jgi:hypothetical protein